MGSEGTVQRQGSGWGYLLAWTPSHWHQDPFALCMTWARLPAPGSAAAPWGLLHAAVVKLPGSKSFLPSLHRLQGGDQGAKLLASGEGSVRTGLGSRGQTGKPCMVLPPQCPAPWHPDTSRNRRPKHLPRAPGRGWPAAGRSWGLMVVGCRRGVIPLPTTCSHSQRQTRSHSQPTFSEDTHLVCIAGGLQWGFF